MSIVKVFYNNDKIKCVYNSAFTNRINFNYIHAVNNISQIDVDKNLLIWAYIFANIDFRKMNKTDFIRYSNMMISEIEYVYNFSVNLEINDCVFDLEASLKTKYSYSFGMAFAYIFGKTLLGIKHFCHLSKITKYEILNCKDKMPDLIAIQDSNNSAVIEAKGSFSYYVCRALKQADNQLNSFMGFKTSAGSYLYNPNKFISYVYSKNKNVEGYFIDPNGGERIISIDIENFRSWREIFDKFDKKMTINNKEFKCIMTDKYIIGYTDKKIENDEKGYYSNKSYSIFSDGILILQK